MGVISPICSQIKTRQSSPNCLQKGEDTFRGRESLSLSPHLRIQKILKGSLDLAPQFQGRQAGNPHRLTLACCLVKVREQSMSAVYWTDVSQIPGWFPKYLYISSGNNPALCSLDKLEHVAEHLWAPPELHSLLWSKTACIRKLTTAQS